MTPWLRILAIPLLLLLLPTPVTLRAQGRPEGSGLYPTSRHSEPREAVRALFFQPVARVPLPGLPTGPVLPASEDRWLVATEAGVLAFSSLGRPLWQRDDLVGALLADQIASTRLPLSDRQEPLAWVATVDDPARLVALRPATGQTVGEILLPVPPAAAPRVLRRPGTPGNETWLVPVAEEITLALQDGTVCGFDPERGEEAWHTTTGSPGVSTPIRLVPGFLVVTRLEGSLDRVGPGFEDALPLLPISDFPTPPVQDSLTAHSRGSDLFVSGRDGRLRALRCLIRRNGAARCRERWTYRTGARVNAPPLMAGPLVLLASNDNTLYAFARDNGHLRWQARASHRLALSPVLLDEWVLVAPRTSGRLQAFRLNDGAPAGEYRPDLREEILERPAVIGDRLGLLLAIPGGMGDPAAVNGPRYLFRILAGRERLPEEETAEEPTADPETSPL